jgi:hypothetical protein
LKESTLFGTPPKKEVKRQPHLIKWYPKTCTVYLKTFPSRKFVILTFYWTSRLEEIVCEFVHTLCSSHKASKKKLFVQEVQHSKILFRWTCQMQTTDYNVKSLERPNVGRWFFWIGSYQRNTFLDSVKLFVKMLLITTFAGVSKLYILDIWIKSYGYFEIYLIKRGLLKIYLFLNFFWLRMFFEIPQKVAHHTKYLPCTNWPPFCTTSEHNIL